MTFPEKLITLRGGRGWSQEKLAQELGVTRQAVGRWERGSGLPDAKSLMALARVFGVDAEWLLDEGADAAPVRGGDMRFELSISTFDWVMAALAVAGMLLPGALSSLSEMYFGTGVAVLLGLLRMLLCCCESFGLGWLVRILPLRLNGGAARVCRIGGWAVLALLLLAQAIWVGIWLYLSGGDTNSLFSIPDGALGTLYMICGGPTASSSVYFIPGLLLGLGHRHGKARNLP